MSSISAGTTTTTGYVVSSDTTGALVLKTGASGTTALTIDTSQNVGIGTASPARKLVVSNAGAQGFEFGAGVGLSSGNELLNYNRSTSLYVPSTSYASTHTFYTGTSGATLGLVLDSSGNLGLGVTPSPWYTLSTVFQSNGYAFEGRPGTTDYSAYWTNAYLNAAGSAFIYRGNGYASVYIQAQGAHRWRTAPSGTAGGTATFTEVMTLDTSGNLGIGTTSPTNPLTVGGTTRGTVMVKGTNGASPYIALNHTATASGRQYNLYSGGVNAGEFNIYDITAGANRLTIDSSGNLGLGVTPSAWVSKAIQIGTYSAIEDGTGGGGGPGIFGNAYEYSSGAYKYFYSYYATLYRSNFSGQHQWFVAPAGTGGDVVTFTQAMTLDNGGNVLVGTTSFSTGGIEKTIVVSGTNSAGFQLARSAATAAYIYTYSSAGFRVETTSSYARVEFSPGGSGGVQLASAGATSWTSLSDERTKTDLAPITDAVQKVSSLRAMTGRFIKDEPETSRSFLIAQDFVDVFPQAVTPYTEKDDDTEYLGLAYTDTIPLLVAAIKEQQALIESLTQRIAALEGQP